MPEIFQDVHSKTEPEEKTRLSSYKAALTSEKNYFQQELNKDFRKIGQTFLLEQIKFYRQLADRLETLYNDCWPHTWNQSQTESAPASYPVTYITHWTDI